jgi:acyl dehydratase
MTERYLEDFAVGHTFRSGRLRIDTEQITTFAAAFDPQPFHLDEEAARDTIFRGLAASGWHTAAVTMRLLVESEVLDVRPSQSHPDQGLLKVRTTTLNQHGEAVQILIGSLVVRRRMPQGA